MQYDEALAKLKAIGEEQLLSQWDSLNQDQQLLLLDQIQNVDSEQVKRQKAELKVSAPKGPFEPFIDYSVRGNKDDRALGIQLLTQGKCATLLVAGGQGTRLGFDGPKGLFPITPVTHKSLFQLFAEKTAAASKQAGHPLTLAIMTSPLNDEETRSFFAKHGNFGLNHLEFFQQGMLPFLDTSGHLLLNEAKSLAIGPDGNGSSILALIQSGIFTKWLKSGVEYLNFVLVDNPLADPFDAELIGFHARQKGDVTVKCIARLAPEEKVGVLLKIGNKLCVVEYSELPESEQKARLPDGSLKHPCANISLFCFSMAFLERLYKEKAFDKMPLHPALKPVSESVKGWKFERFIFDLLPFASKVHALLYPREECFAPLKNARGPDSPTTVQEAIQNRDKVIYKQTTGHEPPPGPFEADQFLYYR